MYLSGAQSACREAAALARAFTREAARVGPPRAATTLKFAGNHLVAIYNVAYAEMVTLCRRMGLDPAVVLQHMGHSPYIGTGAMARSVHCPTPLFDTCASIYTAAMAMGLDEADTAGVAEVLRRLAGDTI